MFWGGAVKGLTHDCDSPQSSLVSPTLLQPFDHERRAENGGKRRELREEISDTANKTFIQLTGTLGSILETPKDTDKGPQWVTPWEIHSPSEGTKSDKS